MTWVVARTGFFVGGLIAAETRVTFPTAKGGVGFVEGVAKVHPVARQVLLGFSGSVPLGFVAVDEARELHKGATQNELVDPRAFAADLGQRLKLLWPTLPEKQRANGLSLILVGADPELVTIKHGLPFKMRTHGFILRRPDFIVEEVPEGEPFSIGSGRGLDVYRAALEQISEWDDAGILPEELTMFLAQAVRTEAHERQAENAIGERMQMYLVRVDDVLWMGQDPNGLASTWEEARKLVTHAGGAAETSAGRGRCPDRSSP